MKYLGPPQSGSIADTTYSHNHGQYTRARTPPTQPSSLYAIARRHNFALGSAAWAALTESQRQAWRAQARPRTDSLGQYTPVTGRNLFLARYVHAHTAGADISNPPAPAPFLALTLTINSLNSVNASVTIHTPADTSIVLYAMPAVSSAVSSPPGRSYFLLYFGQSVATGDNVISITAASYATRFGAWPITGQRLWLQIRELTDSFDLGLPIRAYRDR